MVLMTDGYAWELVSTVDVMVSMGFDIFRFTLFAVVKFGNQRKYLLSIFGMNAIEQSVDHHCLPVFCQEYGLERV